MSSLRSSSIVSICGFALIAAACGSTSTSSDAGPDGGSDAGPHDAGPSDGGPGDGGTDAGPRGDGGSPPGAPILSFTTSQTGVQLTWTLPGALGDETFQVLRSDQGSGFAQVTGAGSVTADAYSDGIASALPGAGHNYEVTASNGNGTGPASNIVEVLQAAGDVAAGGSDTKVIVLWSAIQNASSYDVYRVPTADGGSAAPVMLGNVAQAEFLDDGGTLPIATGNSYAYQIIAHSVDGGQPSTGSNTAQARALGIDVAAGVTHVSDLDGGTTVAENSLFLPYVLVGTDAGLVQYNTFSISNASVVSDVPTGTYFFSDDDSYTFFTVATARSIDMGFVTNGRFNVAHPTNLTSQTTMSYDLTGLAAWAEPDAGPSDTIQTISQGAGNFVNGLQNGLSDGGIDVGQTTFIGTESIDGTFNDTGLVDSTQGDVYYLSQLHLQQTTNSNPYQTITKAYSSSSLMMTDGSTSSIAGAVAAVAPTAIPHLVVKNTAFAAQKSGINPASANAGQTVEILAEKDFTTDGYYGFQPLLLSTALDGTATGDVDLGAAGYGNPFPASWEPFVYVTYGFNMPFDLPQETDAGTPSATFEAVSGFFAPAAGYDFTNVTPPLSPITNVEINGASAFTDQTNVGLTPTFTWSAPATGPTPNTYIVTLYELSLDGDGDVAIGNPTYQYLQDFSFTTTTPSFTLPVGVLTAETSDASHWYFMAIDAQQTKLGTALVDQTATPFKDGTTYYDIEIVTNKFTPGVGASTPSNYGGLVRAQALDRATSVYRKASLVPPQPTPGTAAVRSSVHKLGQ